MTLGNDETSFRPKTQLSQRTLPYTPHMRDDTPCAVTAEEEGVRLGGVSRSGLPPERDTPPSDSALFSRRSSAASYGVSGDDEVGRASKEGLV